MFGMHLYVYSNWFYDVLSTKFVSWPYDWNCESFLYIIIIIYKSDIWPHEGLILIAYLVF